GAPQPYSVLLRKLSKCDVDVIQDFDVIAEKADRLDEHAPMSLRFQRQDRLFHRGSDPGTSRQTLTLKREGPGFTSEPRLLCYELGCVMRLVPVGIAF